MLPKMIHHRFGGLYHALHKFFFLDIPHVVGPRCRVDHGLVDPSIGTANADIFIGLAKAASLGNVKYLEVISCHALRV